MKKLIALILSLALVLTAVSAFADNVKLDKLTFQFVPSRDADVIITGTANLPELVIAEMAKPPAPSTSAGCLPAPTPCTARTRKWTSS